MQTDIKLMLFVYDNFLQPVAAKGHNASISRPLNGLGKTKRASVDVTKAKEEKNSKLTGG